MSKGDAEECWDDYKDYFNYGYGGDYGYGYSDD